ncbi:AfsR/SARP family transcriptional regulator [Streptomyces sp. NPDC000594]|uniref:AfsR/SARP family transcriptional regulator n=1 Tax=Streptomyces sp. NPDC000594 TaxID=3154261 RepID=UPI00332DD691
MEVLLLGPAELRGEDGSRAPLGGARRRAVLATLALSLNRVVPVERLLHLVWDEAPPPSARAALQGHVAGLRAVFDPSVRLITRSPGYVLRAERDRVDVHRMRDLRSAADLAADDTEGIRLLRSALALWRGPALADCGSHALRAEYQQRLEDLRLASVEQLAERLLRTGKGARAVPELTEAVRTDPLRESLVRLLMLCHHQGGRAAEAVRQYHATRELLGEELGVEPGAPLQAALAEVLRRPAHRVTATPAGPRYALSAPAPAPMPPSGAAAAPAGPAPRGPGESRGPGTAGPAATGALLPRAPEPAPEPAQEPAPGEHPAAPLYGDHPAVPPPGDHPGVPAPGEHSGVPVRPAQLPRSIAGFTGRVAEFLVLNRAASAESGGLCLVVGPAGVGKTSLALRWAHAALARFPDGQLFADLHGFDDAAPADPLTILRGFLLALGVPAAGVPEDEWAVQALYRSLLAERRLLVVLDNARDSAQVRPLIAGGTGTATVVTSRNRLDGLVARDGARTVALGMLDEEAGVDLLAATLTDDRVTGDPGAARALTRLCGGLPLALRITAARLIAHPGWPLTAVVDELTDEQRRLAALRVEDADVAAALALSLRTLGDDARRVFAAFGILPGPDVTACTVAATTALPCDRAQHALAGLSSAHLVEERTPGRYSCHSLVRLYSRQHLADSHPEQPRRLLDHALHSAYAASRAFDPTGRPCCDLPAWCPPPPCLPELPDRQAVVRWYGTEADNLRATLELAAREGRPGHTWRLTVLIWPLLTSQVHRDWAATVEHGLRAARAAGDPVAETRVLNLLGWAHIEAGRSADAIPHLRRSAELARETGDACDLAQALINLGLARSALLSPDEATHCYVEAAAVAEAIPDYGTTALALHHLAQLCLDRDRPAEALAHSARALELRAHAALGLMESLLLDVQGVALHRTGRPEPGYALLREALSLVQRERFRVKEADILEHLAALSLDLGLPEESETHRTRARALREHIRREAAGAP